MTVTIEVMNEDGGMRSAKRVVLTSDDHAGTEELEKAAVEFIRQACKSNQHALDHYNG